MKFRYCGLPMIFGWDSNLGFMTLFIIRASCWPDFSRYTALVIWETSLELEFIMSWYYGNDIQILLLIMCPSLSLIMIKFMLFSSKYSNYVSVLLLSTIICTIILLLVFWYMIVGPLELDLSHQDETNHCSKERSRHKGKKLQALMHTKTRESWVFLIQFS